MTKNESNIKMSEESALAGQLQALRAKQADFMGSPFSIHLPKQPNAPQKRKGFATAEAMARFAAGLAGAFQGPQLNGYGQVVMIFTGGAK